MVHRYFILLLILLLGLITPCSSLLAETIFYGESGGGAGALYELDTNSGQDSELFIHPASLNSLQYDETQAKLYLIDEELGRIHSVNFDGSEWQALYDVGREGFDFSDIIVDPLFQEFFVVDDSAGSIFRAPLDGSTPLSLFLSPADGLVMPRGIVVDAPARFFYWISGTVGAATIERTTLLGDPSVQVLYDAHDGLSDPRYLQVHKDSGTLVWKEESSGSIVSAANTGVGAPVIGRMGEEAVEAMSLDLGTAAVFVSSDTELRLLSADFLTATPLYDSMTGWQPALDIVHVPFRDEVYGLPNGAGIVRASATAASELSSPISFAAKDPAALLASNLSAGLEVSIEQNALWWSDQDGRGIYRRPLNREEFGSVLYSSALGTASQPRGIAVDLGSDQVYWADGESGEIVRGGATVAEGREVLFSVPGAEFEALDINTDASELYVSDVASGRILRGALDGSGDLEEVYQQTGSCVAALFVDKPSQTLYFTDRCLQQVAALSLVEQGPPTILYSVLNDSPACEYRGLTVQITAGELFWIEACTGEVKRGSIDGSASPSVVTTLRQEGRVLAQNVTVDECRGDADKEVAGVCGCGIADIDSDGDGTLDCLDQCSGDPEKTTPGVCGCGVPEDISDSNDNGSPDCAVNSEFVSLLEGVRSLAMGRISRKENRLRLRSAAREFFSFWRANRGDFSFSSDEEAAQSERRLRRRVRRLRFVFRVLITGKPRRRRTQRLFNRSVERILFLLEAESRS